MCQKIITKPSISVIIPTIESYNFIEKTINVTFNKLCGLLRKNKIKDFEIIVVPQFNNQEKKIDVLQKYGNYNRVTIHTLEEKGKGIALMEGIKEAKYKWCLLIDDDLEYPIEKLGAMIKYVNNYDIIIASRLLKKSKRINAKFKRIFLSWGYRALCKWCFDLSTKDIQSGMKLINKKKINKFKFKEKRYVWDTELIYYAEKFDLKIKEIPITYTSQNKKIRPGVWGIFKDIIKLFCKLKISDILIKEAYNNKNKRK